MARMKTQAEFDRDVFEETGFEYMFMEDYKGSSTLIQVVHMKCGNLYEVRPYKHLGGGRCPKCARKGRAKTTEEFKEDVYKLVKDEYEVMEEYKNTNTDISMRHNVCGNEFPVKPSSFLSRGRRCGDCKDSKGERNIKDFLDENNIAYEREKEFDGMVNVGNLRFDFYLPEYNVAIEFDGIQHFEHVPYFTTPEGFERQQENDEIKNNYCLENNIPLLRIDYKKLGNEGKYIQEFLDRLGVGNKHVKVRYPEDMKIVRAGYNKKEGNNVTSGLVRDTRNNSEQEIKETEIEMLELESETRKRKLEMYLNESENGVVSQQTIGVNK